MKHNYLELAKHQEEQAEMLPTTELHLADAQVAALIDIAESIRKISDTFENISTLLHDLDDRNWPILEKENTRSID